MTLRQLVLAAALLGMPAAAFAHGPAPSAVHGGIIQEVSEHWVELVVNGDQVVVYVSEQDRSPLPTKEWSGKATILVGGKSEAVTLTAGEGNSATAKLSSPATGKMTAVLQLTIDGKPVQARFATSQ